MVLRTATLLVLLPLALSYSAISHSEELRGSRVENRRPPVEKIRSSDRRRGKRQACTWIVGLQTKRRAKADEQDQQPLDRTSTGHLRSVLSRAR